MVSTVKILNTLKLHFASQKRCENCYPQLLNLNGQILNYINLIASDKMDFNMLTNLQQKLQRNCVVL